MKNYLDMCRVILDEGTWQANRTGIDAISIPGHMLKFDLAKGFPAITTKKLYFDFGIKGELLGFLRGYDNAADFRSLGCKIWDANANDPGKEGSPNKWLTNPHRKGEDDLGRLYGVQWRDWVCSYESRTGAGKRVAIDQVATAQHLIENDPTNRRIIISAWRPDEFDQMALPPCHVLYQFLVNVEKKELNLCMYQRSADCFLGIPWNIASSALFLSLMAKVTGYTPRYFTHFLADAHLYKNHIDQIKLQMTREPYPLPQLVLANKTRLEDFEPDDIQIINYQHHAPIKGAMAT